MADPLDQYPWLDGDDPDPDPVPGTPDDDSDDDLQALRAKVRAIETRQHSKENLDKADQMRARYLESLPADQRGLAVVGLAGAEDPKTMKSHIEKVNALLKDAFPDADEPEAEADDDPEPAARKADPFAPIIQGEPAIPAPPQALREKSRLDRIFTQGDSRAALELFLDDSPVFGRKGSQPIAKDANKE